MPSINKLVNYNLATSVDGGNGLVSRNLWFYGDRSSYVSGSNTWYDLSGYHNDATVSGSLAPSGSSGYIFDGTTNWMSWEYGAFTTSSCVDSGYTIQMTYQPDYATVLTGSYRTTTLWEKEVTPAGPFTSGFDGFYLNDGDTNGGDLQNDSQGMEYSIEGQNNYRGLFIYNRAAFLTGVQNVAWTVFPTVQPNTYPGTQDFKYYVPSYSGTSWTDGLGAINNNGITPTKQFGRAIYTTTGGDAQHTYPYFNFKGVVRDILIYKRVLSAQEIYKNYLVLNAKNALY